MRSTSDEIGPTTQLVGPVRIVADSRAPSNARRAAVEALDALGAACLRDPVQLLVSEIVTNSVVHAECDQIQLTFRHADDRVRVETMDCDAATTPTMTALVRETPGGFGLHIVDTVAEEWGVSSLPGGKVVWFELAVPR
jgi:anti-sigma regulatory factor (Ser/Thr protein kinase)